MRFRGYTAVFAAFLSLFALAWPLALWEAFIGDPFYDSVFSRSLSSLPVSKAGRLMPVSSAAADSLKSMGGKSATKLDGRKISATKWLWLLDAAREKMAEQPAFRTDNKDLQKLLGVSSRSYSYVDFVKHYDEIYAAAASGERTPYARACGDAVSAALSYVVLAGTFGIDLPFAGGSAASMAAWKKAVGEAMAEYDASRKQKRDPDEGKLAAAADYLSKLRSADELERQYPNSIVRAIPSPKGFATPTQVVLDRDLDWEAEGGAAAFAKAYAELLDSVSAGFKSGDYSAARAKLEALDSLLRKNADIDFFKIGFENFINRMDLFFGGFILYILGGLFLALGAAFSSRREAFWLAAKILLAFAVGAQCAAILARMYIQMRPPVTNMYSSVVFTGALASLVSLLFFVRGRGATFGVSCAVIGGLSILVAMNLPYAGDTMGMMRAVLNSNFWLTMHVVTIMMGYCGVFLAGSAAAMRLVANAFDRGDFGEATGLAAKNVYAILCFAMLFSFLGTMLGGIWADMSWGRFWGWDPKENGALMLVLWCAAAIHAKALRLVSDRVFLAFAVFGNIVAAWAWFGVNLMGLGLHSYGFMEGGWKWFFAFVAANILILPLSLLKYRAGAPLGSGADGEKNCASDEKNT